MTSPDPSRVRPEAPSLPVRHWPEYWREAAGLAVFMLSASAFCVLLEHPASPVRQAIANGFSRRVLMGLAMGFTAVALIYSPWGQRSGAHYNPAVTLTFFRLGKVARRDLVGYVIAQFVGGALGMIVATAVFGSYLSHSSVHFVATLPGMYGTGVAFVAEVVITAVLMSVVLIVSNRSALARYTGIFAATCVALFITFEAPFSGMSLNPARSFASALAAHDWTALWIYFVAPPMGMLGAAAVYSWRAEGRKVRCAKLHHTARHRCIFCEYQAEREGG